MWRRFDGRMPMERAAVMSGIVIVFVGFAIGVPGFFAFAGMQASASNDWMLRQAVQAPTANDSAIGLAPYGLSVLTFFIYAFFTPRGLFSTYLVTSGALRAISAYTDDPRGDLILSGLLGAVTRMAGRRREERARTAREELEGAAVPDVLQTGEWAGLPGVDYVVLASRRKAEWTAGAVILTSTDQYKLGAPFDVRTPAGMRTAYPLTKTNSLEVIRRGIEYELPRLVRQPARTTTRHSPDA